MRGWLLGLLLVSATAPACETNHDALAKGSTAKGGAAGSAGRGGSGGSEAGFTTIPQNGGTKATGTGGRAPDEPPGENVLTFMHGIVDAGRVLVCFVAGRGAEARVLDRPASELSYGESLVLRKLEGASFATDDIEPVLIAGQLELVSELGCAEALTLAHAEEDAAQATPASGGAGGAGGAGGGGGVGSIDDGAAVGVSAGAGGEGGASPPPPDPPRLRVGQLPIVPAGTLNGGRSYLLVGNGCIGGPAFAGRHEREACGEAYAPAAPTLSAVLVAMSRRSEFGKLGLQGVQASVATGVVDLSVSWLLSTDTRPIIGNLELGVIVPGAAQVAASGEDYGANSPFWQVVVQDGGTLLFAELWTTIAERAGFATLDDGLNYTLVVLGPSAGLARTGFWNPRAVAIVRSDPTRQD